MSNLTRVILSFVAMATWGLVNALMSSVVTIFSADMAGKQFENSNAAAVVAQTSIWASSRAYLSLVILVVVIGLIWRRPAWHKASTYIKDIFCNPLVPPVGILLLAATGLAMTTSPAAAFFATTDVTEVVYILPNQSAFFIPDTGANKDSQAHFNSVDYLNSNKIASKRFIIPHAKLFGTGGTSTFSGPDYYVPTGRLIMVDRTPFFREWVDATDRGSSTRKEGFHFETKDSIDISTGITISAYVTEENAATFLYWFGTKLPSGDINRPEVQFSSVFHAMPLDDVMDGVVRAKVQEALSNEFSKRDFNQAIGDKLQIMKAVSDRVSEEFGKKGITIDFIGYSGGLEFSSDIQNAINQTIVSGKLKEAAANLNGALPVLQQKAVVDAISTLAGRWDGKLPPLPSVVMLPEGLGDVLSRIGQPAVGTH